VTDNREELIRTLIVNNGPMGVNALSRETGINLSTLQKWLERQERLKVFVKTEDRKWDIPENIVVKNTRVEVSNFDRVVETQLSGIDATYGLLMSNVKSLLNILHTQKPIAPSVADSTPNIHQSLVEMDKNANKLLEVFKKFIPKAPEQYQEMLKNLDIHRLMCEMGTNYIRDVFSPEISSLFLEQTTEISDEVLQTIKDYQKGINNEV